MRRSERGFTLLEVIVSMAIFGMFLFILTALMTEMRHYERAYPIQFMKHPQVIAVLSRMRKDVVDAFGPDPYPATFTELKTKETPDPQTFEQSSQVLIITSVQQSGFIYTVVWDARVPGELRRRAYSAGKLKTNWVANAVPQFTISTFEIPGRPYSVRLKATDRSGKLAIDQILQPRAHE